MLKIVCKLNKFIPCTLHTRTIYDWLFKMNTCQWINNGRMCSGHFGLRFVFLSLLWIRLMNAQINLPLARNIRAHTLTNPKWLYHYYYYFIFIHEFVRWIAGFCFPIYITNLFTFEFSENVPFKIICFFRLFFHHRCRHRATCCLFTWRRSFAACNTRAYTNTGPGPVHRWWPYNDVTTVFICGWDGDAFRCNVQFYDTTCTEVDAAHATRCHIGIIGLQFSVVLAVGIRYVRTDG